MWRGGVCDGEAVGCGSGKCGEVARRGRSGRCCEIKKCWGIKQVLRDEEVLWDKAGRVG